MTKPSNVIYEKLKSTKGSKDFYLKTPEEIRNEKTENRLLQPGVLDQDVDLLIKNSQLVKERWITSYACPSIETAIFIKIAKNVASVYQVDKEDYDKKAHEIFDFVMQEKDLKNKIQEEIQQRTAETKTEILKDIISKNKLLNDEIPPNEEQVNAAIYLAFQQHKRKITYEIVEKYLNERASAIEKANNLEAKPICSQGNKKDIVILGAPGEGKSTLLRSIITEEEVKKYLCFSTDDLRRFTLPGSEEFEKRESHQMFLRSQDLAYLIKEEVVESIKEDQRPNILFDGITLEGKVKHTILKEALESYLVVNSAPGFEKIPERAYYRAKDQNPSNADRNRYVNLKELLEIHSKAQVNFKHLPDNMVTKVYDSHVNFGDKPVEIAVLNGPKGELEISNLIPFANYLNKSLLNTEADNPVSLIQNPKYSKNITHPSLKAELIEQLLTTNEKPLKSICLKKDNQPYLKFNVKDKKLEAEILDEKVFSEVILSKGIEAQIVENLMPKKNIQNINLVSYFVPSKRNLNPDSTPSSITKITQETCRSS